MGRSEVGVGGRQVELMGGSAGRSTLHRDGGCFKALSCC